MDYIGKEKLIKKQEETNVQKSLVENSNINNSSFNINNINNVNNNYVESRSNSNSNIEIETKSDEDEIKIVLNDLGGMRLGVQIKDMSEKSENSSKTENRIEIEPKVINKPKKAISSQNLDNEIKIEKKETIKKKETVKKKETKQERKDRERREKNLVETVKLEDLSSYNYDEILKWAFAHHNVEGSTGAFTNLCLLMKKVKTDRNAVINAKSKEIASAKAQIALASINDLKVASKNYFDTHNPWTKSGKIRKELARILSENNPNMLVIMEKRIRDDVKYYPIGEQKYTFPGVNEETLNCYNKSLYIRKMEEYYRDKISKEEIIDFFGDSSRISYDRCVSCAFKTVKFDVNGAVLKEYEENDKWNREYIDAIKNKDYVAIGQKISDMADILETFDMPDLDIYQDYGYISDHFEEVMRYFNVSHCLCSNILNPLCEKLGLINNDMSLSKDKLGLTTKNIEWINRLNEMATDRVMKIDRCVAYNAGGYSISENRVKPSIKRKDQNSIAWSEVNRRLEEFKETYDAITVENNIKELKQDSYDKVSNMSLTQLNIIKFDDLIRVAEILCKKTGKNKDFESVCQLMKDVASSKRKLMNNWSDVNKQAVVENINALQQKSSLIGNSLDEGFNKILTVLNDPKLEMLNSMKKFYESPITKKETVEMMDLLEPKLAKIQYYKSKITLDEVQKVFNVYDLSRGLLGVLKWVEFNAWGEVKDEYKANDKWNMEFINAIKTKSHEVIASKIKDLAGEFCEYKFLSEMEAYKEGNGETRIQNKYYYIKKNIKDIDHYSAIALYLHDNMINNLIVKETINDKEKKAIKNLIYSDELYENLINSIVGYKAGVKMDTVSIINYLNETNDVKDNIKKAYKIEKEGIASTMTFRESWSNTIKGRRDYKNEMDIHYKETEYKETEYEVAEYKETEYEASGYDVIDESTVKDIRQGIVEENLKSITAEKLESMDFEQLTIWANAFKKVKNPSADFAAICKLMEELQKRVASLENVLNNYAENDEAYEAKKAKAKAEVLYSIKLLQGACTDYSESHEAKSADDRKIDKLIKILFDSKKSILADMRILYNSPVLNKYTIEADKLYKTTLATKEYYKNKITVKDLNKIFSEGQIDYERLVGEVLKPIKITDTGELTPDSIEADKWNMEYINAIKTGNYEKVGKAIVDLAKEMSSFEIQENRDHDYLLKNFEAIHRYRAINLRLQSNIINGVSDKKLLKIPRDIENKVDIFSSKTVIVSQVLDFEYKLNFGMYSIEEGKPFMYNAGNEEISDKEKEQKAYSNIREMYEPLLNEFTQSKNEYENARKQCQQSIDTYESGYYVIDKEEINNILNELRDVNKDKSKRNMKKEKK